MGSGENGGGGEGPWRMGCSEHSKEVLLRCSNTSRCSMVPCFGVEMGMERQQQEEEEEVLRRR